MAKTITIDGKTIPFEEGQTIMEAAAAAGVYIPCVRLKSMAEAVPRVPFRHWKVRMSLIKARNCKKTGAK
jgi:hypothetical protein